MMFETESTNKAVGEKFVKLVQIYENCAQKTISKYGLYLGQPQLLFCLKSCAHNPTQNELALMMGISKASAGVSIRRLESAGFISRVRDKKDSRCIRIALTSRGTEYTRWCEMDYEVLYTTMFEGFTGDQRAKAFDMLDDMFANLSKYKGRMEKAR